MLRSAASTADRENHEKITNDILPDAAEDAREDARAQIKQKSLDSLTQHQRVVYDIVRDHGPSDQAKFTTAILRRSTTHRRSGLFTYLSKMPQYNLLEAEGTSRDRVFTHRFGSDLADVVNC